MPLALITKTDIRYAINLLNRALRFAEQESRRSLARNISALAVLFEQPRLPEKDSQLWDALDFAFQRHVDFLKAVNASQANLIASKPHPPIGLLQGEQSTLNSLIYALSLWKKFHDYHNGESKAIE